MIRAIRRWLTGSRVEALPPQEVAAQEIDLALHESRQAYSELTAEAALLRDQARRLRARGRAMTSGLTTDASPMSTASGVMGIPVVIGNWVLEALLFLWLGLAWPLAFLCATFLSAFVITLGHDAVRLMRNPDTRWFGFPARKAAGGVIGLVAVVVVLAVIVLGPARAKEVIDPQITEAKATISFLEQVATDRSSSDQLALEGARADLVRLESDRGTQTGLFMILLPVGLIVEALLFPRTADLVARRRAGRLLRRAQGLEDDARDASQQAEDQSLVMQMAMTEAAMRHGVTVERRDEIARRRIEASRALVTPDQSTQAALPPTGRPPAAPTGMQSQDMTSPSDRPHGPSGLVPDWDGIWA